MRDAYRLVHYRGDVTELARGITVPREDGGAERTVPVLLGADAFGRPYEVLDVELEVIPTGYVDGELTHRRRSTVHLQPATTDTLRGNRSTAAHQHRHQGGQIAANARVIAWWAWAQGRSPVGPPAAADTTQGAA